VDPKLSSNVPYQVSGPFPQGQIVYSQAPQVVTGGFVQGGHSYTETTI